MGAKCLHDVDINLIIFVYFVVATPYGQPGGYFPKNWVGVCGVLLETLTLFLLFQTKICDFHTLFQA